MNDRFVAEDYGTIVVGSKDDSIKFKSQESEPQATSVNDGINYFYNYDYTPTSNFNMVEYFENLYTYSPINNIGSCGFVSLIQEVLL